MTRIIAGQFRGRRLAVPSDGTRPTSDRVREAIFSALGARRDFTDAKVLDLYAGSGALGLEALSRDASSAVFVESDRRAAGVINENIAVCDVVGRGRVLNRTVGHFLRGRVPTERYDLVFYDPPYEISPGEVDIDIAGLVDVVAIDGYVVAERGTRNAPIAWPPQFTVVAEKAYGDSRVTFARRDAED